MDLPALRLHDLFARRRAGRTRELFTPLSTNEPTNELGGGAAPSDNSDTLRARKTRFLEALALVGNVSQAAELAAIHRDTHYGWLEPERDPEGIYRKEVDAATERFRDRVRAEVRRRAIDGWMEPVTYQGQFQFVELRNDDGTPKLNEHGQPERQMVAIRKFSDRLLERLAEAKCPEFKQKHEIDANVTGSVTQPGTLRVLFVDPPKDEEPEQS